MTEQRPPMLATIGVSFFLAVVIGGSLALLWLLGGPQ